MTVILQNTPDDPTMVPKIVDFQEEIEGTVRGEISIENPEILIKNPEHDFNYVYIPQFNRWYFVRERISVRTDIMLVICEVDVLQSHYQEFFDCPMIASRSSNTYNSYIKDTHRQYMQYTKQQYVTIGEISEGLAAVLVAVG